MFMNMFKDLKENVTVISEQSRNLGREIKAINRNGKNSGSPARKMQPRPGHKETAGNPDSGTSTG